MGTRIWSSVRWLLVSVAACRLACGEATRGNHVEFTSERGGFSFGSHPCCFFGEGSQVVLGVSQCITKLNKRCSCFPRSFCDLCQVTILRIR